MIKIEWKTCLRIGVSVFLVYLCIHYWSMLSGVFGGLFSAATPLFIGAGLAFIVNGVMSFYERHFFPKSKKKFVSKCRRPVCLLLAYLTFVCVIVLLFWVVIPEFLNCIQLILKSLPDMIKAAIATMQTWEFVSDELLAELSRIDWRSGIDQFLEFAKNGVMDVFRLVVNTVFSVFSGIFTAVISVVFSIYLLSSKERLGLQVHRLCKRFVPEKINDRIFYYLSTLNSCFRGYIVGQMTEALILGSLVTVGMLILGLPYATMIGALVAVMALIPIAGAYISGGIGALMLLSDSPIKAVIFVVFLIVLQQIEGNVIYPRVVGSTLGLPGIWVLAAVILGGGLFGILGMIVAVPVTATVYKLLKAELNDSADFSEFVHE